MEREQRKNEIKKAIGEYVKFRDQTMQMAEAGAFKGPQGIEEYTRRADALDKLRNAIQSAIEKDDLWDELPEAIKVC